MDSQFKDDKGQFRRKFPRRIFKRLIGVICAGDYSIYESGELGEGGLSVWGDKALPQGQEIVVTFQIPGGDFVSMRSTVRTCRNEKGRFYHGLSFDDIPFSHKRQIRGFVSARAAHEEIN